jgi:phage terminase small subunit
MQPLYTLPEDKFGATPRRYNLPNIPAHLPERALLAAANDYNEYRFYKLTANQRLFVDEYFRSGFDEGAALKAAYLAPDDADEAECRRLGRKLVKKPYIQAAIDLAWDYHRESVKLSLPEVIEEIKAVAFANMGDYFENDGNGEPRLKMPESHERYKLAAIQEIQVETYQEGRGESAREVKRIKFKLYNKLDALEKLLKALNVKGVAVPDGPTINNNVEAPAVTNNVSVINLLPVPSGSFLPPPEAPTGPIIEHSPLILTTIPAPA